MRRLLTTVFLLITALSGAQAEDLVVDRFVGSVAADANSNIGENLKYGVFQWAEGGDAGSRPLGGVRHFSSYLNSGSHLRLATENYQGSWFVMHQAETDTRGSSVIVWDGDAQSRGGNTRGLARLSPDLTRYERLVIDDLQVDIPPGGEGDISILISFFDRGDATSNRMLNFTARFSKSRSRSALAIPLDRFELNDSKLGKFSNKVGAISLMVDGGERTGVMVRFSAVRFEGGVGTPQDEYVEEEQPTATTAPTNTLPPTSTATPTADQWVEFEATPDPFDEEYQPPPTLPPTAPAPTATPSPTHTPRSTATPSPTPTQKPPTKTPTPYYGRCVINFEGKVVCVKFPGRGKHECSVNPDCNTPTPTPPPADTATPRPTPTPKLSCLCACRSLKPPNEYLCANPWVFRASRLGYTCPDKELGNFPWSFELDASAVPSERSATYCADRWNNKDGSGYDSSSTSDAGVSCRLTECREGALRRAGFM